jgi:hypothetical protein
VCEIEREKERERAHHVVAQKRGERADAHAYDGVYGVVEAAVDGGDPQPRHERHEHPVVVPARLLHEREPATRRQDARSARVAALIGHCVFSLDRRTPEKWVACVWW